MKPIPAAVPMLVFGVVVLGLLCQARSAERSLPLLQRSIAASGQGYFPVALRLRDGRIAVVMRGGATHLGLQGRLDIIYSADEGKTWSKPAVVVDTPVDDRNPALGQAGDGSLVIAYWRTARYDEQGRYNDKLDRPVDTWVTRLANGGSRWSEPQPIDVGDIGWGSPYGRMLTMPDGSMLMNIYGGPVRQQGQPPDRRTTSSYVYRSTDDGRSWKRFGQPGPDRFNETSLLRLNSGTILAAMRSEAAAELWLADSGDGGRTWTTTPRKLTPPQVHPADMVLLPDGRVLLTSGYRVNPFGVCGVVGDANGSFDWSRHFMLVDDASNRDCGYPSSVILKNGQVLSVYYAVGRKDQPSVPVHCGAIIYSPPQP